MFGNLFGNKESGKSAGIRSIYDFRVTGIDGKTIDFAEFRGKKILIVNTASKCGFTHQYAELEILAARYRESLVIVGFPSNNFLFQEPGANEDIQKFCEVNYHISFPMAARISVRGWHKAPIYKWLTQKAWNGWKDSTVTWNFQKYLVDTEGNLAAIFSPKTSPLSAEVIAAIEMG